MRQIARTLLNTAVLVASYASLSAQTPANESGTYTDRNRYFTLMPPGSWVKTDFPNEPRSKVQFATTDVAMMIIAYRPMTPAPLAVAKQNQESQLKVLESTRGARGITVRMVTFAERESVESMFEMGGERVWVLNFYLPNAIFVTVSVSGRPQVFEAALLKAQASLATLLPLEDRVPTAAEIRAQAVARLHNRAKIEIDLQRYAEAESAYRQILELDPGNATARDGLEKLKIIRR
jgi:hypothetical protein